MNESDLIYGWFETACQERDQAIEERDEARKAETDAHSVNAIMARTCNDAIRERDEARELAREILDWYGEQGLRPNWEKRAPWLRKAKL